MGNTLDTNSEDAWRGTLASRIPAWGLNQVNKIIAACTRDQPTHPVSSFPWHDRLAATYPEVRREMEELLRHVESVPTIHELQPNLKQYYSEREWRHACFCAYGFVNEGYCELYPKIWEALQTIHGLVAASVSILPPGETLPEHIHSYKGFLIVHLGIVVPEGDCGMNIGGEKVTWEEGGVVVIDPTFVHDTWNYTDKYRAILLGEFRRPDTPILFKMIDYMFIWGFALSPVGKKMFRVIRASTANHLAAVYAERKARNAPESEPAVSA